MCNIYMRHLLEHSFVLFGRRFIYHLECVHSKRNSKLIEPWLLFEFNIGIYLGLSICPSSNCGFRRPFPANLYLLLVEMLGPLLRWEVAFRIGLYPDMVSGQRFYDLCFCTECIIDRLRCRRNRGSSDCLGLRCCISKQWFRTTSNLVRHASQILS